MVVILGFMNISIFYVPRFALIFLVVVNIISFFIMMHDKKKAVKKESDVRIPEGVLFFMASLWAGVGVFVAMIFFRHKTRKWYFKIGIPLLILQNILSLYGLGLFFK